MLIYQKSLFLEEIKMDISDLLASGVITTTGLAILSIVLIVFVAVFGFGIICYVFISIALYHIDKRRALGAPGLAWIPVGNVYTMGKIADAARLRAGAKRSNLRIWLLVLALIDIALAVTGAVLVPDMISQSYGLFETGTLVGFVFANLMLSLVSTALVVLEYVALFSIYRSLNENYVLFLVLSIIFPVVLPFLLFAVRKKEREFSIEGE